MPIRVDLDVMLARRKMKSKDLAAAIGISETNLSLLKRGHVRGIRFGTLEAIVAAATDPETDPEQKMGPGPRAKIRASLDYLEVAPRVVAVVRDLDLGDPDTVLPQEPADPERLA